MRIDLDNKQLTESRYPEAPDRLSVAIACESPAEAYDGVSRYCAWLTEALRDMRHSATELRPTRARPLRWQVAVPANGNRLPVVSGRIRPDLQTRLHDFDVVHVQAPFSPRFVAPIVRTLPEHAALVATFHSTPRDWKAEVALRAMARLGARSARRLDAAIAVSPTAAVAAWCAFGQRCQILDPVVPQHDPTRIVQCYGRDPGSVVFIGRLVARKGVVELVDAFVQASAGHDAWRLEIIGDGPLRSAVAERVRIHQITNRVRLRGALTEAELSRALQSAQLVCAPSTGGESFGMVLIDAMRHGALVIGGANDGHRYALRRGEAVADVRDPVSYAELIRRYMTDEGLRRQALAHQTERLNSLRSDRTLPPLVRLYREVIDCRRASAHA